jgi:hypothetical protein
MSKGADLGLGECTHVKHLDAHPQATHTRFESSRCTAKSLPKTLGYTAASWNFFNVSSKIQESSS